MKCLWLLLFILSSCSHSSASSSKRLSPQMVDKLEHCPSEFKISKAKESFRELVDSYRLYPCFPTASLKWIEQNHPKETWIYNELSQASIVKKVTPKEELFLLEKLEPFLKTKSEIEKSLLRQIQILSQLKQDSTQKKKKLEKKFPSYGSARAKQKTSLKIAKDLKRRGLNKKALKMLKKLRQKQYWNHKVHKELISVQKNVKRNADYLRYSQDYVNLVYRQYKNKRKHRTKRRTYLTQALLNIRRIWTYRSTSQARKKLETLINYHCKITSECAEHYWILGRILEEQKEPFAAHKWLKKALINTPKKSNEYTARLWNLVWLENKVYSSDSALKTAEKYIQKIPPEQVSSKLYFWMSKWSPNQKEKYKKLIREHHPLSFYLWSHYALGENIKAQKVSLKNFGKNLSLNYEKNLFALIRAHATPLARAYLLHVEKKQKIKKSLKWKKLKALSGLYADLLLDLEADNINIENNLAFFFSQAYEKEITNLASKYGIKKELVWSIIRQESNFNSFARSWADAFGLMQILPKRAEDFYSQKTKKSVDFTPFQLYRPEVNIEIGSWLLKKNLSKFNQELPLAIAAYNASENKVFEWKDRFLEDDWLQFIEEITYRETRKYVKLVLRNIAIYQSLSQNESST